MELLGELWVAFSPLSGESHLLNDASAAILELLAESGPLTSGALVDELSALTGSPRETVSDLCAEAWTTLIAAGLIREVDGQ